MRAFSASCLIFASRARIFSSREFLAMPDLSKVSLAAALTCASLRTQVVLRFLLEADLLAAGEDLVTAVLLVPLGERGGHVHLLDDVAPAHAGVVGAEGDLAFLRGVGDDALLGAAEIVIEQILEPHAGDEEEVPAVAAALLDVVHGAVGGRPCRSCGRWRRSTCRTSSAGRSA